MAVAQCTSKRKPLAAIAVVLLALYVGSHCLLSRYSAAVNRRAYNIEDYCYVPMRLQSVCDSGWLWASHRILTVVYLPVWAVDHYALGGPRPVLHMPSGSLERGDSGDTSLK